MLCISKNIPASSPPILVIVKGSKLSKSKNISKKCVILVSLSTGSNESIPDVLTNSSNVISLFHNILISSFGTEDAISPICVTTLFVFPVV